MPKPTVLATEEFIEGKIMFRKPLPETEIAEETKESKKQ
jgi:hypothetical protein